MDKHFKGFVPIGMKHCYKCGRVLPKSDFHKDRTRYDGVHSKCKECKSKYNTSIKRNYTRQPKWYENFKHRAIKFPLEEFCELCPEDDIRPATQRHHPSYDGDLEWFFVSCCASCHYYADRNTEEIK